MERHTKSDIERGEKARNRYRTDISNLDRAAEESSRVNNSLRNELKPWSKEASTMMMMMRKRINKERRTKMTLQKDTSKNSKTRLEELLKRFDKYSEEEKKSGKYWRDTPSLTLSEARKLGINTEPTLVISFGRRPNNKRSS